MHVFCEEVVGFECLAPVNPPTGLDGSQDHGTFVPCKREVAPGGGLSKFVYLHTFTYCCASVYFTQTSYQRLPNLCSALCIWPLPYDGNLCNSHMYGIVICDMYMTVKRLPSFRAMARHATYSSSIFMPKWAMQLTKMSQSDPNGHRKDPKCHPGAPK